MYYYCNRTTMSASAFWPGAEGPHSCCVGGRGGGGGGGELVNGNGGGEITEARAIREWESATCDSANATRSASTDTRDREDGAARGHSRCCGGHDCADGEEGGVRCAERTSTEAREVQSSDAARIKRRGCSYSGASKRACFPGTLHCGGSDPDSGTGTGSSDEAATQNTPRSRREPIKERRRGICCEGAWGSGGMEDPGGEINGKRRGCGTARGRVRLCRVRSFMASTEGVSANGVLVAPLLDRAAGGPSVNGSACAQVAGDAAGSWFRQVEASQVEVRKRQVQLGQRTDMLWRRLHAMQVTQVERHVTQQLGDLRTASLSPNSAELRRLARSCSEALRTAGGAVDSDHTASSSGGSESEEEEEEEEGGGRRGRHVSPSRVKSVCVRRDWPWMQERAWLGSRWVWLQAQVSELEYGIRALTELYTDLRQGKVSQWRTVDSPGTSLRARRSFPAPQDCRKKLAEDSASSPHAPHASSAARVRPLLPQFRHRLIRLSACPAPGAKFVTLPCCCEPPAVRLLCASPHPPVQETSTWALEQCIHPVLSMPLGYQDPGEMTTTTPPLAGLQSHNPAKWMERRGQRKAGRVRRRVLCPRPPGAPPPLSNTSGVSSSRSQRGVVSPGLLPHHTADLSYLFGTTTDPTTPPARRRRGESSFDIDNLVMPLGLAGLRARVQKLQYKDIDTPSWRELDSDKHVVSEGQRVNHTDAPQQLNRGGAEHTGEVEDLSDSVFLKRHTVWESRERNRWGSRSRRRHRGRSSSYCGNRERCRGLEQTPCSPELGLDRSSSWRSFYFRGQDEQQSMLAWERRSFPLLEEELRWLQDDEEAELEEDVCAASGRSQSTDSGISVGSVELSPRTPKPHQLHSGGHQPVTTTQDPDSTLPLTMPPCPPCLL